MATGRMPQWLTGGNGFCFVVMRERWAVTLRLSASLERSSGRAALFGWHDLVLAALWAYRESLQLPRYRHSKSTWGSTGLC